MFVKKFEGETLEEALKEVKMALGPDAIILKTRTNKGLKGAFRKKRIEITAAISEESYEKKSRVDHVLTTDEKDQFYSAPASRINNMINEYDSHRDKESQSRGYANMGLNKVVKTVSKASHKLRSSLDDFLAIEDEQELTESGGEKKLDQFLKESSVRGHDEISSKNSLEEMEGLSHRNSIREFTQTRQNETSEASLELRQDMRSQKYQIELLEKKLFELTEKVSQSKHDDPKRVGLFELRANLRALDLSEGLIQKLIKKVSFEFSESDLEDSELVYDFALRELNNMINVGMPLFSSADIQEKPVVTVLLSESSCGQSSMAMKLAVLHENVKIIRFRSHALDSANSEFTQRVFKLDITTVDSLSHLMSEARKAIQSEQSLILDLKLNFAGTNESKKFIETLKRSFEQVEFLVTISAIHSELYNRKILSKYHLYVNGTIISYIDQCLSFGSLLNVHGEHLNIPIKFFGTGAVVPDDIEAATAERLLAGMFQL